MPDLVAMYAMAHPDKLAVIDDRPGKDVIARTYAEHNAAANRLANVLADRGVGPRTKIVWCGQNSIGVVTAVNAAAKLGATSVPLNYRLSDEEAAYVTDHSDTSIVIVDAEFAPMFQRIRSQIPKVTTVFVYDGAPPADDGDAPTADGWFASIDELAREAPDSPPPDGAADVAETMIYTSGTTGKPKGAVRNVAGSMEQVGAMVAFIGYTPDDVYITTGPLYHSGPGGFMGLAQALGQTVVVQRKFEPEDWLRLVETYRCTSTFSAPTPMRMICHLSAEVLDRFDRSSMRVMIANAAPWSFALKQRYVEVFPPTSLFEVYGSTELGVNTILRPEDQMRKPGSCGKEAPMVEVRLYDEDGNAVTGVGPGAAGELFVRSPSVFADYYKQHDRFEEDNRDGWQTVGDIAYRDDEGFLYICDRKKDMIISGGMNIYPAEVESVLEHHPDIYEAAVFGIPSDEWGEAVHAVVVARPGSNLDDDAVIEHARVHLAGYKVPRSISWMEELPKTGSGKILKRELRAPYWEGRDALL
jgi:fatty-acyl-CoA synthase/long-chain acyl-CoA synthetase